MRARPPSLPAQLLLLWRLRLELGLNGARGGRALAVVGYLATAAPALGLGLGAYRLFTWEPVARSALWPVFLLELLGFTTTALGCTWPVLSAGVDDHSELSRYAALPVSGLRLLIASSGASLLEPRALVFYSPVVGAVAGYARVHALSLPGVAALFLSFVLFNAAWSRVALHALLGVLRREKSGALLGGGVLLFLGVATLIPPIDTSWLLAAAGAVGGIDDRLLEDATLALSRVPSGYLGHGLGALARQRPVQVVADVFALFELGVLGLVVAWGLLLDFHRQAGGGRGAPVSARGRDANPFAAVRSRFGALVAREALDLWHNPRARLLATVPFVLAILLKLVSARALFQNLLGPAADAWLLGALSLYGAVVLGATFSQNAFGYDGHGFTAFLVAPVELGQVLLAKNGVHGAAALLLSAAVCAFYRVYFGAGRPEDLAFALCAALGLVPVLLAAGNLLSLHFPVRFHASLQRRDRVPFVASMLGVAAAGLGTAPALALLRSETGAAPGWGAVAMLAGWAALAWAAYAALLPLARAQLARRRERVLHAVTRQ